MTEQTLTTMEEQLAQLQEAIAAKRAAEGVSQEAPVERAEVHAEIGKIRQQVEAAPRSPETPMPSVSHAAVPAELQSQVQELVTVAFTKGTTEAVSRARQSHNSALVDALHDLLADKFHALLVERHKLSQAP